MKKNSETINIKINQRKVMGWASLALFTYHMIYGIIWGLYNIAPKNIPPTSFLILLAAFIGCFVLGIFTHWGLGTSK